MINISKKFEFLGNYLEFSDEFMQYNSLRMDSIFFASKGVNQYISDYYDKYGSLDNFVKGYKDVISIVQEGISNAINIIVRNKIYDVDEKIFIDKYGEFFFSDWLDAYYDIADQYMEIELTGEQLDEYRTLRRQTRGRIIGGGFGISGAAKGIATAGLANMTIGAAHGAVNLVGKGITSITNSNKKHKIYTAEDTRIKLKNALFQSIFKIHYCVCDVLNIPIISEENIKKSDAIYSNIKRMEQTEIIHNLINILTLNPYKKEVYILCLEMFGDENHQISSLARTFGINLKESKKKILETFYKQLNTRTEEDSIKSKDLLEKYIVKIGIDDPSEKNFYLDLINKKIVAFDKAARTVDNIEFGNRELAEIARSEFAEIQELLKSHDYKISEENAKQTLNILKSSNYKTQIVQKYISELNNIIKKFDIDARTYNGKVYQTRDAVKKAQIEEQDILSRTYENFIYTTVEEANLAKKEDIMIKKVFDECDKNDYEEIIKTINLINEIDLKTNIRDKYLEKLENEKDYILDGIRFLKENNSISQKITNFYYAIFKILIGTGVLGFACFFAIYNWGLFGIILSIFFLLIYLASLSTMYDGYKKEKMRKKHLYEQNKKISKVNLQKNETDIKSKSSVAKDIITKINDLANNENELEENKKNSEDDSDLTLINIISYWIVPLLIYIFFDSSFIRIFFIILTAIMTFSSLKQLIRNKKNEQS